MASESEKKFDEISRRLGVVQEVRILVLMIEMVLMLIYLRLCRNLMQISRVLTMLMLAVKTGSQLILFS